MTRRQPVKPPIERDGRPLADREGTVIDDTLATTAVFDMTPDAIQGTARDPEGLRIGEQVADAVLADLERRDDQRRRDAQRGTTAPPVAAHR
jgi:hypothetical protein